MIWTLLALSLVGGGFQSEPPQSLSFAGVSLSTRVADIKERYPNSSIRPEYIHVSPKDSHDHISGIAISGTDSNRVVRIEFERRAGDSPNGKPQYPLCSQIQMKIQKQYGPPTSTRSFFEERVKDTDRVWVRAGEELTLRCFRGSRGRDFAEAILIHEASR